MEVNPNIFKAYDIRGIWQESLFPETAYKIGLAMGTYYKRNQVKTVYISRDNRVSGKEVRDNLAKGLRETGRDVVDLGLITTPMNYASWHLRDANASINITASHNPPRYNGFKASLNKVHFSSEDYQDIKELVLNEDFDKTDELGEHTTDDIWADYRERIVNDIELEKSVTVALDCGNGTCSGTTEQILKDIGCEVITMYCQHDGTFPNHPPYPQKQEYYGDLIKCIKNQNADLGIAMDGDGDRFGIYDENGNFVSNDLIGALIGTGIAKENPGMKAVFNTSTSRVALDQVEQAGGEPVLWKTGYPHIIAKMKEIGALLGNEISGHFFLKDRYYGFDDGTYAAARFIEYFSKQDQTVSEMVADMPDYVSTPEFRVPAPDEPNHNKFTIIADITEEFKDKYSDAEIMDFDGLRIHFPDRSWVLIRNSNTEPLVTGRAEAKTTKRLEELKTLIKQTLKEHDVELDWNNPIANH